MADDPASSTGHVFAQGVSAYDAGRYQEAVQRFRVAAEGGDASAEERLGELIEEGRGVEKDLAQAAAWYLKAADQGNLQAENKLAEFYSNGWGVEQDAAQAVVWYRKAADHGDAQAALMVGLHYQLGSGVPQDISLARDWFRRAGRVGSGYVCDTYKRAWLDVASGQDLAAIDRRIADMDPACTLMIARARSWRDLVQAGAAANYNPEAWLAASGANLQCGAPGSTDRPLVPDQESAKSRFLAFEASSWPSRDAKRYRHILVFDGGDHWSVIRTDFETPKNVMCTLFVGASPGQLELSIAKCNGATTPSTELGVVVC